MLFRLFFMIAAMFCAALAASQFSIGEYGWGAVLAVCVAINLINFFDTLKN